MKWVSLRKVLAVQLKLPSTTEVYGEGCHAHSLPEAEGSRCAQVIRHVPGMALYGRERDYAALSDDRRRLLEYVLEVRAPGLLAW